MVLHQGGKKYLVRVLLDTGCSIPLINQQTVARLEIGRKEHLRKKILESYTGHPVNGAGEYFTEPMTLQHRNHYTQQAFVISPMETKVDVFLPFWWIAKHPPQGAWDLLELGFSSPSCLEKCTHFETA